ncbi:glycine dehydrogenase [Synechococcus sp. 60AY4M2]|jgi:glycine dehydrogenase|uniref:aminomethyl-transferring glycine dehydrogenase n=1 Tax=unclassified Synechococcus TaxID=2626047 RepID=UPI000C187056|nr:MULTISPECIES: aminomethyl-transferring glycine dehydrogenase [unclassified Synechococcus]PIK95958.1 glycine dehydrogenase [Synechococcus sp. 60AY4M2]PIK98198.1 glycine dehydrogenase [Synechococcus sp. 63AY4M1]
MSDSTILHPLSPSGRETPQPLSAVDAELELLEQRELFLWRHIGPDAQQIRQMLHALGLSSLRELVDKAVPAAIRSSRPLGLGSPCSEQQVLAELRAMAAQNQVWRSFLGMGYSNCLTPPVIQRNILENPGWYTQYTPYQAEIAQGRLEALLNFQTMVIDLTGREIANASLLDEATAAAEAMSLAYTLAGKQSPVFWVDRGCHPQTIAVVQTRAEPLGIQVRVADPSQLELENGFGLLLQYPNTYGEIRDYRELVERAHQRGMVVAVAADLLSLTLLQPPGEWGADIVVGSTQRFGVPLGYGGPHAAYFATREAHKRLLPGRLVGISQDAQGRPALRLALQTREQHIRRDKATSNICTAQVLLAVVASMYAVYHGPRGLRQIAERIHRQAHHLAAAIRQLGYRVGPEYFFDTFWVRAESPAQVGQIQERAAQRRINLRRIDEMTLGISLDEATTAQDLRDLWQIFAGSEEPAWDVEGLGLDANQSLPPQLLRTTPYLTHPVFNRHHSETELLRYIHRLQSRDLSLVHSMIPLGSCTMKLNATAEMLPMTWPEFAQLHPFVPLEQARGYQTLFAQLEQMLAEITGFAGVSLQPNAGSQGEYAGLLAIRRYHQARGESQRQVCLIPTSAHGTNPASAVMAGMQVVSVACDRAGNIDLEDLRAKVEQHRERLAALMITYPSTHGVFEEGIREICQMIHEAGGQVYMDGANLNAQVGLCRPAELGADVCHLNLHKTFCIPHGGGGPGVGPIAVARHLLPHLPGHPFLPGCNGPVSAAPWGSASILPIAWAYIRLMGSAGLTLATQVALLNANYIAKRLDPYYPVLYKGPGGWVAHECILDLRPLKKSAGIEVEDVAKRLMDYGFHAPTISWPVPGTMMVEPTESESLEELDRFCEAMIAIRQEIAAIERGEMDPVRNPLKLAPHTAEVVAADHWDRPYPRSLAAYPLPWVKERKFWPSVSRIDNAYGDRHLVCSCQPWLEG